MVFTPKYRRGPFTDEILIRCEEVMWDVCADFGAMGSNQPGKTSCATGHELAL